MKVLTVVGARPQFIKAAPVSHAIRKSHREILVHTGQHYDEELSTVFFKQLAIPEPDFNLGVGSGPHGRQTGKMLIGLEKIMISEKPDWVLIYGDTNSTLASALAAAKLGIPLAHIEAGLRSFNWTMPEEVNRVLSDRCSDALFCPTETAINNLAQEGIHDGVYLVGDVMYDALLYFLPRVDDERVLARFDLSPKDYVLATIHRASNTDKSDKLLAVLDCLSQSPWPVLLPLHPRTRAALNNHGFDFPVNVHPIEPVGYLEMLALEKNAVAIMTDSGGVQKEAYILGTPCITLRDETEWVETTEMGWNRVVGLDSSAVAAALISPPPDRPGKSLFGDGQAATRIVEILVSI